MLSYFLCTPVDYLRSWGHPSIPGVPQQEIQGPVGCKGVSDLILNPSGSTDVLEVRYRNIQEVLQFPRDTQELDDLLRLTAKVAVDLQSVLGIDM